MPSPTDANKWRQIPQWMDIRMMMLQPAIVAELQVNQGSFQVPINQLAYSTVISGDDLQIQPNQLFTLGTTRKGFDLGRQRVKDAVDYPDKHFLPAYSSLGVLDGEINPKNAAYITVYDDRRVWTRMPYISTVTFEQFMDSNISYVPLPPKANAGGGYARMVDPISGVITVPFDGTRSFSGRSGHTITDYFWDFVDGTPSEYIGATPGNVTFPPGFRWVRLAVLDGGTIPSRRFIPVYAGIDGDPMLITDFEIISHNAKGPGQTMTVRVNQDISGFMDGCLMMMWREDFWHDGSKGAINVSKGLPGREHMMFTGWHIDTDEDATAGPTALGKSSQLNFVDVGGKLSLQAGFSQLVDRASAAGKFTQQANLTINGGIHYILVWMTTAWELADWNASTEDYDVSTLTSDSGGTIYTQVDKFALAISHQFTCDREGSLWVQPDPQLLATHAQHDLFLANSLPVRTDTVVVELKREDWSSIRHKRISNPRVFWFRGYALLTNTTDAAALTTIPTVQVIAPGPVPGQGTSSNEQNERVVRSANEFRVIIGNEYRAAQNPDTSGLEIVLVEGNEVGIDVAYLEWVQVTMSAEDAAANGMYFNQTRALPVEMNYTYNHKAGTRQQVMSAEIESIGIPAAMDTPVVNSMPPYVAPGAPPPVTPPIPFVPTADFGPKDSFQPTRYFALTDDGHVLKGTGPVMSPTWVDIAPGSLIRGLITATIDPRDKCGDMITDPYNYDRAIIMGPHSIVEGLNMNETPTYNDLNVHTPDGYFWHGNIAGGSAGIIVGSINWQGYFGWLEIPYNPSDHLQYAYTNDNFATVHHTNLGIYPFFSAVPGLTISQHAGSWDEINVFISACGSDQNVVSRDGGQTFSHNSDVPTPIPDTGPLFKGGANNLPYTLGGGTPNTGNTGLITDLGQWTHHQIVNIDGTITYMPTNFNGGADSAYAISSLTVDGNYLMHFCENVLSYSTNGGHFWASINPAGNSRPGYFYYNGMAGWPTNPDFVLLFGDYVSVSFDKATYTDITPPGRGASYGSIVKAYADLSEKYDTGGVH